MAMNNDPIFLRILDLMEKQRKGNKEITKALGLANGIFSQWKNDEKRKSYLSRIDDIAYFLETTPTYLLRGEFAEKEISTSAQEVNLLNMYRKLSDEKKNCIDEILRIFSEE